MKLLLRLAVLLSLTLSLHAAALPFAQAGSDLKPDAAVHFGTLPNGVRYVVMPNKEPQHRASLRLLVLAGAFNEQENQRGLAHFLEHMAFNGSTHFAPGTLVEFFQRMGMSFGGDTNAYTSFDHTLYMLELPDTKAATLEEGFQVFADYAGGLLLRTEDVAKERGIILSEKRTRDNVGFRTMEAQMGFLYGDTLLPKRLPIGLVDVIEHAPRDRFTEFWNTWYRPELLVVIAVGDFDPAAVEQQIKDLFTPLTPRAHAAPAPDLGKVAASTTVQVHYHPESEAPGTTISINAITPYQKVPDTAQKRLSELPRAVANAMLNRRFSILAKKENAPFISASAEVDENFDLFRQAALEINCKPEQWTGALAAGEQELRRAIEHGFQPSELSEIVAGFENNLRQAVKTAATRRSGELAGDIAQSIVKKEVFTSPEDDLALYGPALKKLTVEDCAAALRATWAPPGRSIFVSGNVKIPGDATAAITQAYEQSRAKPVAAPSAIAEVKWGYTEFGAPGKVVKREHIDDLDITLVTFANGVRLNLKPTTFEANRIRITARLGTGQLTEPRDQPGLGFFASQTFIAGGLGKHSADDLRRILAGKTVGVAFNVAPDAFAFLGATNRDDLQLELQLLTAHITDPGYRPEALRQARKHFEQLYLSFEHTAQGPLTLEVPRLLASGDPRFGLPHKEALLSHNFEKVNAWVGPQLKHAALEIGIVGDFDVEDAIKAVAATIGTLPARDARPALDAERKVAIPSEPITKTYTIVTQIPKGTVVLFWPTTDGRDVKRARRMSILAETLSDRLRVKVREEIGGAYSPSAGSNASEVFPNYGFIGANVVVEPAKAKDIANVVAAAAQDLHDHGVTEDELKRAKEPALTSIRESVRTNQYWMTVLMRAQEKPEVLDWARTRESDVQSIATADLNALAKAYLGSDRAFRFTILPEEKTTEPVPAEKAKSTK